MIFYRRHRRALLTVLKFLGWELGTQERLDEFDEALALKRGGQ